MGILHLCLHLFLSLMSGLHVLLGLISIKVLAPMLGRNVYAYVDDMVVASKGRTQHVTDLEELFVTI